MVMRDSKVLASLAANTALAICIYLAMSGLVPPATYLVIGFVWLMMVNYLIVLLDNDMRRRLYRGSDYRYLPVTLAFDISVTVAFVVGEWLFTAGAYVLSCLILFAICYINPDS
jgi:hypothetical protein